MTGAAAQLLSVLPTLVVPDARAAAEHYRDVFGFRLCFVMGQPPEEFAIVDLAQGQGLHLASCSPLEAAAAVATQNERPAQRSAGLVSTVAGRCNARNSVPTIDVYLRVPDADAAYGELKRRGARLLSEPQDTPWQQREFGVEDLHGFRLCYGADLTGQWPAGRVATSPEFVVNDVARSAAWYQHVLGFQPPGLWGDPPSYGIVKREGVTVHLSSAAEPADVHGNAVADLWDAYVECRQLDAYCAEIRARGAAIRREPVTREYGMREFEVQDLDGYVLCFGEEVGREATG